MAVSVDAAPRGIDLGDPAFWRLPEEARAVAFARLRERPGPVGFTDRATGRRCWALVRHADVAAAGRAPEVYRSGPSRWTERLLFGDSLLDLDGPRHAELRRTVGRAFPPRPAADAERELRTLAAELADRAERERPADLVAAVAAEFPHRALCALLGLPPERLHRTAAPTGGDGPRARLALRLAVSATVRERRRRPADDLLSALAAPAPDGPGPRELAALCSLLLTHGARTTRDTLTRGLQLLAANPDQRALLLADPDTHLDGAVEEIARCAAPSARARRTVAVDHRLSGIRLATGDQVLLCHGSANRDAAVFAAPDTFDITRSPNPHLGFGGAGPHFCLGAQLARRHLRILLPELLTRLPETRPATAPSGAGLGFTS
ncbi:cytochrome P450 [Kitasatospora cineracea]|uniref:cytochrome P450 n=1 Tax=Kitasatospora cineracea TaxID=88074 RepID=UPI003806913F